MGKYTSDDIKQMYSSLKTEKCANESSKELLLSDPIFKRENLEKLARICEYLDIMHAEYKDKM